METITYAVQDDGTVLKTVSHVVVNVHEEACAIEQQIADIIPSSVI